MQEFIAEPRIKELGVPDIEIRELKIWTHSRKYPESKNFWDVNWLNSTFYFKTANASVWVSGDILHNTEIEDWVSDLDKLNKGLLEEEAVLKTMERYIKLRIAPQSYQRISIEVDFFPEQRFQTHHFEFWVGNEFLKTLIDDCHNVLIKFPVIRNKY